MDTATPLFEEYSEKCKFGLAENASDDTIAAFGLYCLTVYNEQEWTGDELNEYFYDDFKALTQN